jgi:neutral ceramidase
VATSYDIGTGIGEVTDPAVGLPMQGMADRNQVTAGVESRLYARAFVIADPASVTAAGRVAVVAVDIWSATRRVKDAVLKGLAAAHGDVYIEENVLLAGTHTHSAPGGYSGALVYDFDFERGGCDEATVRCISDGCIRAVEMAHANLAPGRIYVNRGDVVDCGRNRSVAAYMCNPQAERDRWGADTDRELLLLKFVKVDGGGDERPVGVLSWYPIHPTDRGQRNMLVSGDNRASRARCSRSGCVPLSASGRRSWPRSQMQTAAMCQATSSSDISRTGSMTARSWRSTVASSSR